VPAHRRCSLEGSVQALLVIDPQVGLLREEPVPEADQLVTTLQSLISRARRAGVPTILFSKRFSSLGLSER
jgi:nicotinamidase-related amidase